MAYEVQLGLMMLAVFLAGCAGGALAWRVWGK